MSTEQQPHHRHRTVATFWRSYALLPHRIQLLTDKQFALLKADAQHPSLRSKPLQGKRDLQLWSARVSQGYRALATVRGDEFVWFWVGDHTNYEKLIRNP